MHSLSRRVIAGFAVLLGSAVIAPAASATIAPTVTLDQSAGMAAASTANLGVDLKFGPSSNDSPKDITLGLPAGLLANASIDGGACLASATPIAGTACQVGTGTVTATENVLGQLPLTLSATFDLVAPPSPGDLAGLDVLVTDPTSGQPSVLGTPAAITVRPSTSPAGVGLNIAFTNVPDTYPVLGVPTSISVDEIKSTFDSLRYPSSCPATPANFTVTADSYGPPPTTPQTVSAPLQVTGCAAAPFAPKFGVLVNKDSADSEVQVITAITQNANEATSRTVALAFPSAVLGPNLGVAAALCANPSSGTCTPVGSASATSPLYPTTLAGHAYLTGSLTAPVLTLTFPPPFSLTLNGQVSLANNSTTFQSVPDIPLTELVVTLSGGKEAVFQAPCTTPSGTATATLTTQNGDRTVAVPWAFSVTGCPPATTTPGGGGTKTPPTKTPPTTGKAGLPKLASGSVGGLVAGKPALSFKVTSPKNAPKLRSLTIKLPKGLSFVRHRVHKRLVLQGISVTGAQVKSRTLKGGRLVITLRRPSASVTVKLAAKALRESTGLKNQAKHHRLSGVRLTVSTTNTSGKVTNLALTILTLALAGG